ncbi:ADP-ribosylglycohydrolase family protein [Vineibacter terrae]|uniref:ADP-ribosylglycohydrolase family protein n=1 Tax=Vineibacter terrae TaxID=2586908 RepID=UPI002E373F71|nr:ADP-ribosylglycohydrolase family protein [Vineibacter terrae]HEX2890539.1 ADP-ribosylglycohydrolase family protein [Vineibacter terrae]
MTDQAIGCLVGLAVGDALGTTLEFSARDAGTPVTDIVGGGPFGLNAGEWTDDTSMALCLADSLLACRGLDPPDLMERFRRWRDEGYNAVNGRCFDIGITTRQAIDRYLDTQDPLAGSADPKAAGNGSIMRLAPVPIFHAGDAGAADAAAVLQSRTTHAAIECLDSCRLMSRILVALLNGASWPEALAVDPRLFTAPKVQALAAGTWKRKTRADIKSTGYVIDTLEAALWAVDTCEDFTSALLLAVNLGEDADTVGAVTGQLAGARHGLSGIPAAWRRKLAWHDHIAALAQALAQLGTRPHATGRR